MSDLADDGARAGESFRLIYRSRMRIPRQTRTVDLGELFSAARSNNKKQGISGALLLSGDWFVQILEGDERLVRALYEQIAIDPRHDEVTLLESGHVPGRVFSRWAMARVSREGEPDIPLIAHTDGISPAAGRGTTPEQETVLERMRQAARVTAPAG